MRTTIRRIALAGLLLAPLAATPALAQSPTPEGTVITNTATASWTDANNNTYTPVTASASVTVGFLAGPDVASPATATPASPSTGNELAFTVTNTGNGTDSVTVTSTIGTGATITGYKLGGTTYATITDLNNALASTPVPAGTTITITVIYTVQPGQGGQTIPVSLTATSRRTPATPTASDTSTTNLTPAVAAAVAVTPDGGIRDRLPSNGTTYTETFTVTNNGNASDVFDLAATKVPGTVLTIVSVNGTSGASSTVTIASGGSATVTVVYTVGNVAAGSTDTLRLTATSQNNASVNDPGHAVIRVIRPALTMAKAAYRDDKTTTINNTTDRVLPGDYIWYRITVTNAGGADAASVSVSDPLPAQLTYVSNDPDATGWTISESSGTVTATLTGGLAPGASRYFWIRARVK